jgi:hypothetical protein
MEKNIIHFKKELGYPMTIHVETSDFYMHGYHIGFQSIITDDSGTEILKFTHEDLRGRIHWVDGFFTALNLKNGI